MTRKLLFAAILCACLPQEAFSQAESVADDANPPCCGQSGSLRLVATPVKGFAGAAPSRSVTRQNVEKILLRQTKATQLTSGVHVVSRSPQGYKLMATVSQQGRVNDWYVVDPQGHKVARMNNGGGDTEIDLEGCINKFIQNVADCDQYAKYNPFHYRTCLQWAWGRWIDCLGGKGLTHGNLNLTPVGGSAVLQKK